MRAGSYSAGAPRGMAQYQAQMAVHRPSGAHQRAYGAGYKVRRAPAGCQAARIHTAAHYA